MCQCSEEFHDIEDEIENEINDRFAPAIDLDLELSPLGRDMSLEEMPDDDKDDGNVTPPSKSTVEAVASASP